MGFRFIPRGLFRAFDRHCRRWHETEHAMRPSTKGVLGYRPPGTKPDPRPLSPSLVKEDRYGDGHTIHHTNTVDVEIGPTGEVCAVWFRCRMLPFTQNEVVDSRCAEMLKTPPETLPGIKAIVFDKDFPNDG